MSRPEQTDAVARFYDEVPYESRPFPQSHPARSAAVARLFGLAPPDIATARVLELGCAAGGNLIPLAAGFPEASFVGVDISSVQVADGQARIHALGLGNIALQHRSIADLKSGDGVFDYIICHGVYSWVPEPVRDAILRVARELLSPNGVVYVSYNVFPGWRLRGALRDAMLFHVEPIADPAQRVAVGRAFLATLAEATNINAPYGHLLREEARMLAPYSDAYISHEFLEIDNEPCYVRDFIWKARVNGLEFLSEANLNGTIAETYGAATGKLLRDLSGNQLDRIEQYADFLTGRTFRQTLLVRNEQVRNLDRMLTPERLTGLHISVRPLAAPTQDAGTFQFVDGAGRSLSTPHARVRDCLASLSARYPATTTAQELCAELACFKGDARKAPGDFEATKALVQDALFKMVLIGMAEISTVPMAPIGLRAAKPAASALARLDASSGQTWTTNSRHEAVALNVVEQAMLPALDGAHDLTALHHAVALQVAAGRIRFLRDGQELETRECIEAAIEEHVSDALRSLAKSGLLEAA